MPYVKVPESVISVIETDVAELARDPEGHGLSHEELMAYRELVRNTETTYGKVIPGTSPPKRKVTGRIKVPDSLPRAKAVAGLLTDLSNTYDAMAEEGRGDKAFDRRAASALGTAAGKFNRLIYGEDLGMGFRLRKDGAKYHLYQGEHLVLKFPTKRSAVAVFEMARARKADRERTAKVLQDLYRDKKKSGIPGPEKEANDTFVYVVQKVGIPRPDWYQDERMALMGLKPESPGGAVGREWNSLRQGRRKVVGERMIRGQRMYVVRSEGVPRETFFPVEDLENVIAVDESELRSRAEAEKRDATRAKEEAKARAEKRNLRGFEKRFSGVQLERVIDTLNRKQGVRGVFLPRREHMENLVREGYVVRTHPKYGRVLEGPDGGFFFEKDLTKTALDYADYLSNVGFGSTSPERRAIPAEPEEVDSFLMEAFGFGGDS